MNWIVENSPWLFSGAGATLLGIAVTYLFRRKKGNEVPVSGSGIIKGTIRAKSVHITQSVVNQGGSETGAGVSEDIASTNSNPALSHVKQEYFGAKNELRSFLLVKLAEARSKEAILQVRHITDAAEGELALSVSRVVSELEKLEEEGLIHLARSEGEIFTPYTRIRLREKYFDQL